jgi:hypothetical protein
MLDDVGPTSWTVLNRLLRKRTAADFATVLTTLLICCQYEEKIKRKN